MYDHHVAGERPTRQPELITGDFEIATAVFHSGGRCPFDTVLSEAVVDRIADGGASPMAVKRTVTKRARSNVARINIPALNTVRREYLLGLARKYEDEVDRPLLGDIRPGRDFTQWTLRRRQCLKIAAIYREMADFAFSGDDPEARSEKEKLAAKLRAMTVANGCTEAEAETAQMMLFRLEGEEGIPCA